MNTSTLQRLKERVNCDVVTPRDGEYDEQRTPWLHVLSQLPLAIVNAANADDIAATIRFARENDLELAIQNTGHGIVRPCNSGILLRLSGMKRIAVDADDQTAVVEPGVRSGELLAQTEPLGLVFPTGQAANVGVIGYTLGGGIGWLARKLGAACGFVQSATVVTAEGEIITVSADENPDLFWALRGGGGNFGVVAELTVKLTPLRAVFGGLAYYRMEDAREVMRFYREWSASLPDETSTVLRLMQTPPTASNLLHLRGTKACAIGLCDMDADRAQTLRGQLEAFKTPAMDDLETMPYSEMGAREPASSEPEAVTYGTVEGLKELSDPVIDRLLEVVKEHLPPLFLIELQQFGGALDRASQNVPYTPFGAPFALHLVSPTLQASLEELAVQTQAAAASLGPVFSGERSYNYLRGDQQNRVPDAFTPEKYARLRQLKRRYDPTNFFHLNMNIPPA